MKPQLLHVNKDLDYSFSSRRDTLPDINSRWHYHPEVELIYIRKGTGNQFVGDNITPFSHGNLVLIGPDLPHCWQFDDCYFNPGSGAGKVDVYVVHFNKYFWGETFLNLPENRDLKSVLDRSKWGIQLNGDTGAIGDLIEQIVHASGARKIMLLMEALLRISHSPDCRQLASLGFQYNFQDAEKDRITAIYNYSITNFQKKITLEEIASVANISPSFFCKYFKSRSRKTYSDFLNELRVGHACKLLIGNTYNVKEVCFQSGFYNQASFYRYFKKVTGKSPVDYQRTAKHFDAPHEVKEAGMVVL
ncbi:AraC family transcriptional regulator [Pararcticibacter amylolyticus]|uniref:AraC family transcriptional regulator n=1 Tax=Pararcticibacter amylolyticus TaxID=2173175 RepID=A0A2U2PAP1_9SPHI|nr:AraC family transcriptional regulator [Pararcticibacter amylolyticus]PWG78364.1 AraC family transcriptional regulator [Pararcticibacter amylolyticus]